MKTLKILVCLIFFNQLSFAGILGDGISDKVNIGHDASLDPGTGDFTREFWLYIVSFVGGTADVIGWKTDAENRGGIIMSETNNIFNFEKIGNTNVILAIDNTYDAVAGVWTHYAFVCDRDVGNYILVNGVRLSLSTDTHEADNIAYTSDLEFLYYKEDNVYANVIMDGIRYWNVARTDDQIKANMYRRISPSETSLVGYWRCDEGKADLAPGGLDLLDFTGNGNEGTATGTTFTHGAPIRAFVGQGVK